MNNLKILFKNNFNIMLGNFQGKKKRASTMSATLLLIICAVAIVAVYSYQAWTMFDAFSSIGLANMLIFHSLIVTMTVVVTIGVMRITINATSTDEWLLLSLPIKKRDIIISKVLNRYLFDLVFVALLLLPFVVIYLIKVEFNSLFLILGMALTLLLPLLSVGISNILGFIVSKLFNKFRSASLFKSLISVFIFVMVYGMMIVKTTGYGFVETSNMEEFFSDRPISNLLLKFLLEPNFLRVFLVLALTIIPFAIGLVLYGMNYGKATLGYHTNSTEFKFGEGSGTFASMLKKELNTYGTTPAYIANTIIGPILMLGLSILLSTSKSEGLLGLLFGFIPSNLVSGLIAMLFGFCVALTTISACSISLEGKSLWILQCTPINEKVLFLAKATLQMVIVLPFIVASGVIVACAMDFALIDWAIIIAIPSLMCILFAFGGVVVNLWLPMLEWDDESKVVKQSMAILVAMLAGMVLALLPLGVYYLFDGVLSISNMFLVCCIFYILLINLMYGILFTWGVKRFRNLTE